MASFSDLPSELVAVIAQVLMAEKAYESCASLNQTCRATFHATCPVFWHTIDFRFTMQEDDPSYVEYILYNDGRQKHISKPLRRKVRHMLEEVWLKAEACQKYTKYILLPLSPLITGETEYRVPPRGDLRVLDTSKMTSLKAIIIVEAYCGSDGFDVYLGNAFRYGTNDARDVILFCDPDAEGYLDSIQEDAETLPTFDSPNGLNLMITIGAGDSDDHAKLVSKAFFDAFLLMRCIDVAILSRHLEMTMSTSSRLTVELETIGQLKAFTETLTRALSCDSSCSEIAIDITCHEQPAQEALADILRSLAEPLWRAQNEIYQKGDYEHPRGCLSIVCGENRHIEGTLHRESPESHRHVEEWSANPASSPLRLEICQEGDVCAQEWRAQGLVEIEEESDQEVNMDEYEILQDWS